jgi:hypothetical protein
MQDDFKTPLFSRALLTAVFVGIVATVLSILCDIFFVKTLHFPLADYINVSTLIFGVNIAFLVIGFIYYGFVQASPKGELLFIILFIILTALGVWRAENAHRVNDRLVNSQFRNLLSAIILIIGLLAAIVIPILFHSKKFEKYVV